MRISSMGLYYYHSFIFSFCVSQTFDMNRKVKVFIYKEQMIIQGGQKTDDGNDK